MATGMTKTKVIIPTPPDKGSFPLDHEGECKDAMIRYLECLRNNKSENTACRQESSVYLKCRMDKQLMAPEEWSNLGFKKDEITIENNSSSAAKKT